MKTFSRSNKRVGIRDGLYLIKGTKSAYLVDFYGNIFFSKEPGSKFKIVEMSVSEFNGKSIPFGRNLTDNEIFAMRDVIDNETAAEKKRDTKKPVLSDVCHHCGAKLKLREIETTMTADFRRWGKANPERCNHWGFGCPNSNSNSRECFDETHSTEEGAKENYYARAKKICK